MLNIEFDLTSGTNQIKTLKQEIMDLATDAGTASEQIKKALNFKAGKDNGIVGLAAEFSILGSKLLPVKQRLDSVVESVKYLKENTVNLVSALKQATAANKATADSQLKQANSAAEAAAATAKSAGATKEDIRAKAEAERIVKKYSTAQEKQAQDMERLADLVKRGVVSEAAYASTLDNVANSQKKNSAETKKAADATKGLEQEVKSVSTEISRYIDLLNKQNSEFNKSSVELMKMKAGWLELDDTQKSNALSALRLNEAHKLTASVIKSIDTPAQQLIKSLAAINLLFSKEAISEEQAAEAKIRLRETYKATRKAIADESNALTAHQLSLQKTKDTLLSYVQSLITSNQALGKNSLQLLESNSAFKLLSVSEQETARAAASLNDAMQTLAPVLKNVDTPAQQLIKSLQALSVAQKQGQISEEQAAEVKIRLRGQYDIARKAVLDQANALTSEQKAVLASRDSLVSYLATLTQTNAQLGMSKTQVMQASAGWGKLSEEQQKALISQQKYADTMGRVSPILARLKTDAQVAKEAIKDLDNALAANKASGGVRGINQQQYNGAVALVNKDLEENRKKAIGAANAVKIFSTNTGIANQVTAGFRAALMGANLGFGMFTSSTVLTAASMFGLAKAITYTVSAGAQFEVAFERAAVIMEEFGSSTDGTLGTLSNKALMVQDRILDLAENTQYGTVEVARAAGVLAQAGLEPIEVFNALGPSLHLAAIGMVDVAEAADIAVGVMYGFGKSSQDLGHIVDVMAKVTVESNLSLKQVGKTMEYIAPVARQMGMTVEEAAAAIGILGNISIKGSKAGTSLRSILTRATLETKGATAAFTELGIKIEDFTQGGVLNLQRLFSLLEKKGASVTQMKTIMGQWAITAAFGFTHAAQAAEGGMSVWDEFLKKMKDVDGVAKEMAAGLRKNLTGAVEDLKSVIETVATRAFQNYGQDIEDGIRGLTQYIKANQNEIVQTLTSVMRILTSGVKLLVEWGDWLARGLAVFLSFKLAQGVLTILVAGIAALASITAASTKASIVHAAATEAETVANGRLGLSLAQVVLGKVAVARADAGMAATAVKSSAKVLEAGAATSLLVGSLAKAPGTVEIVKKSLFTLAGAGAVLAAGFRGLLSILTGWVGVLLMLASIAVPPILEWFYENSPSVIMEHADAFEKFSRAMEMADNGFAQLDMMDPETIKGLGTELSLSIKEQQRNLEQLGQTYDQMHYRGDSISMLTAQMEELRKASVKLALNEQAYTIWNAKNTAQEDIYRISLANRNRVQAEGLMGSEAISKINKANAEDFKKLAEASDLVVNSYIQQISLLESMARWSGKQSGLLPELKAALDAAKAYQESIAARQALITPDGETNPLGSSGADVAAAEAAIKAQVSALESQVKAYEKSTVSITEYNQKLREVTDTQKFIAGGSKDAVEKLKELGMTASEAMDAMKVNKDDILTEYFAGVLTKVDARYKDLGKTVDLVGTSIVTSEDAFKLLQEAILKLDPASRQIATALLNTLKPALESVASGNSKLAADFQKLSEEAALMWAKLGAPSGLDALINQYKGVGKELTETTVASIRFGEIFGDSVKKGVTEAQKISEANRVLDILRDRLGEAGLSARDLARLMEDLKASLPTGALLKENENLQNQTALLLAGVDSLDLYNAAWEATNGHLEDVTDAFIAAKLEQIALQKQLEQIQAVRGIYEQFGDGVSKIFTDLFTGGIKSFKDFADRLKSQFKQMIADLMAMAIKNSIFKAMFGTEGNTPGFWQALTGAGGNSSGGNILSQISNAIGGGNSNAQPQPLGPLNNLIGRFFGGGGGNAATASGFVGMGNVGNSQLAGLGGNYGSWTPGASSTSFGATGSGFNFATALPYAGAALGGMYGLTNRGVSTGSAGSLAAGAAYGVGGLALGTVGMYALAGGAGAAGMGAGAMTAGAMGGASMGAAAVPVVGWIVAAVAAIDMITGGKVFGTRYRPESSTSTTTLGEDGGTASATVREVRQRSLFRGRQWRNRTVEVDPEAEAAAEELFNSIQDVLANSARQLRTEAPPMIDAAIRSVTEYDNKGKVKSTKLFVDILGRTWEEATSELAATRITGEAIIYAIDEALGYTFGTVATDTVATIDEAGNIINTGVGNIFDDIVRKVEDESSAAQPMGEASTIAERWRDDAENLLDGAQFLLMAATDMRNGLSLFEENAPGILTQTADIIEELAYSNETLQEAYVRVRDSVSITERTLGGFGVELGRTRSEFITFSSELVEALGGIDAATDKLTAFSEAFGSIANMGDYTATQASTNRATLMTGIGLDPGISAAEFIAAFTAGIADMAPEVAAQWINAGMALVPIHNALESLRQQAEATDDPLQEVRNNVADSIEQIRQLGATEEELAQARMYGDQIIQRVIDDLKAQLADFMGGIEEQIADLNGTEYENQITSINRAMADNIEQARSMGASLADLARIEALAALQIRRVNEERARQLSDMMHGIEGQISQFEGRTFIYAMQNIRREMDENVRTATALGASTAQLARIQQLAAYQIAQAMSDLRFSIEDLADQLYGEDAQSQAAAAAQQQSDYSAQQQAESQTTNDLEQRRYDAAQSAIKQIDEYLRNLAMGQQSPGGWRERLSAAKVNFEDIYARAMQGDPEAMSQLADAANSYLQLSQEAYGPGSEYADIFRLVTGMLRNFSDYAATIPKPVDPVDTGGNGGGGGSGGDSGSNTDRGMSDRDRYRLALELAQHIGELGIALDTSVFDLMEEFGIDIQDLAKDLGIDSAHFTATMGDNLRTMASSLGVGIGELMAELGITSRELADAFGISLTEFNESNISAITDMAETMGISTFEAIGLLGIDLADLAASFGVDIAHLNSGMGANLISLAGILGISLGELSSSLGLTLSDLATAFGVSVGNLSEGTLAGLTAMADALGISVGDLVTQLGISLSDLAVSFGIDIDNMNANTVGQLSTLAGSLGMSVMALIGALGIDLNALATSFGLDLDNMNSAMFARFVAFSDALGLDLFEMVEALGGSIELFTGAFVTAMNEGLDNIPDLPDDIRDSLNGHFSAIAGATTAASATTAVNGLGAYINSLPGSIKDQLTPLFTSLGGTFAGPAGTLTTADYQVQSLAKFANIESALGSTPLSDHVSSITSAISTGAGNIVTAIEALSTPPAPPTAAVSSMMAYWQSEDSAGSGASEYYEQQSTEVDRRTEEALALSLQAAENLKLVEEKLEEVTLVLEEKLTELSKVQAESNEKLQKISKHTNQMNEKTK